MSADIPQPILTRRESRKQNVHKALGEMWESLICVGDGNCVAIVYHGNSGGTSSRREDVEAFADELIGRYNTHPALVSALEKAVEIIKVWHACDEVWDIYYNSSPEMAPVRHALRLARGEDGEAKP